MTKGRNKYNRCFFYKLAMVALFVTFSQYSIAQQKRNLLTDYYSPGFIQKSIPNDYSWIKYPDYKNREIWDKVSEETKQVIIANAEEYLEYNWPPVTATSYLDYARTGSRNAAQSIIKARIKALHSLVFAELIEGKGRFLDDIINGVFSFCEQTTWEVPSRFYLYGYEGSVSNPTTILPDVSDPIIGLTSSDIAADLAWIYYFFKEEFDKVSPIISRRLKYEIENKILIPFYTRNDFWWMTGWGEGRVNNWTPWCNFNVLTCILLVEDNPTKKLDGIYKTMRSVDLFINSYPDDGACSEGPSYWAEAAGNMYRYLDLLEKASGNKICLFNKEIIQNMGKYIYRAYIGNGNNYVNFADAPLRIYHDPGLIYRYGKSIQDSTMMKFAAFLFHNNSHRFVDGKVGGWLENVFNLIEIGRVKTAEPLISEYYFPGLDLAIARDAEGSNNGFYFSAKGGSNAENHNHNDVGSFMLYYNGQPVFIDVGVGTYTKETFGKGRYNIWTMQSNYHNVPEINNVQQEEGSEFEALNSEFEKRDKKVVYKTEITNAYPKNASVNRWERTYKLDRGKRFVVEDEFDFKENKGTTNIHFMSQIPCKVANNGTIELNGKDFSLKMKYDATRLKAAIETITLDDSRLQRSLGKEIYRITFRLVDTVKDGKLLYQITRE